MGNVKELLRNRLLKFEKKDWRAAYNSLIVLEHLLTHGPESVAEEFQSDKDVMDQMKSFQYIDDRGFNWGLTLQKKSERILMLLEEGPLLKQERDHARKLSRGIQGFGSFSQRSAPTHSILPQPSSSTLFGRCNSDFNNHHTEESQSSSSNKILNKVSAKFDTNNSRDDHVATEKKEESDPIINRGNEYSRLNMSMDDQEHDHPFNSTDMHSNSTDSQNLRFPFPDTEM